MIAFRDLVVSKGTEIVDKFRPFNPVNVVRDQVGFLREDKVDVMFYEKCVRSQEPYRNGTVEVCDSEWYIFPRTARLYFLALWQAEMHHPKIVVQQAHGKRFDVNLVLLPDEMKSRIFRRNYFSTFDPLYVERVDALVGFPSD